MVVIVSLYLSFTINSLVSPGSINSFKPTPSITYSIFLLFEVSFILSIHIAIVPLFCTFTLYDTVEFTCFKDTPIVTVSLLYLLV